jgi:maltose alpha-D-glucosyltransferase/alpha-amylase
VDALEDPLSARAFVDGLANDRRFPGRSGTIVVSGPDRPLSDELRGAPHAVPGAHANTLLQLDDTYVLKVFHRAPEGTSIDLEIERALGELGNPHVRIVGDVEYVRGREPPVTLAIIEGYVPNAGTAWHHALADVGRYYERVLTTHLSDSPPTEPPLLLGPSTDIPSAIGDLLGNILDSMTVLGQRTAELHRSLLGLTSPALAPEDFPTLARRSEYQSLRNLSGIVLRQLRDRQAHLTGSAAADAAFVLERKGAVLKWFDPLLRDHGLAVRIRSHGDFHLEQVLFTGKDFVILDFEGEQDRSFNDRRRKRSPLRDVACMLRSIENAALVALWEPGTVREVDRDLLSPWGRVWSAWGSSMFLAGYRQGATGTPLLPERPDDATGALHAFMLERTLRDLREELEWQAGGTIIPLRALARMLESDNPRTSRVPPT